MLRIAKSARATACAMALCAALFLPVQVMGAPAVTAGQSDENSTAVWLPISHILQEPELPNGCEVTSLAMLLAYHGYNVPKTELAERYLPTQTRYNDGNMDWGGDPEEVFPGNPADDSGWYCYAKPLATAANRYLTAAGAAHTAEDVTGVSVDALEEYLREGTPVAVWLTIDGLAPRFSETAAWRLESGKWLRPYVNVHCAVLTGFTENSFLFADPLGNFAGMNREDFAKVYTQLGSRAMILVEGT